MGQGRELRYTRRRGSNRANHQCRRRKCCDRWCRGLGGEAEAGLRLWERLEHWGRRLLLVCEVLTISLTIQCI